MKLPQLSVWLVAAAAIAMPLLYVGSYAVLIELQEVYIYQHGTMCCVATPGYRIGGEAAESFYEPMHDFDRWLRPGTWDAKEVKELPANVGGFF